ncbi:MAG: hypothetical protein ACSLFR_14115 [Solirubrobacteraceae bacterium]
MCRRLLGILGAVTFAVAALPGSAPAAISGCPWTGPVAHGIPNVKLPDRGAAYWVTAMRPTASSHITLRGSFPHARYMSLNAYDAQGRPTDSLPDVQVGPDPGATNPFVAGADRAATARTYTLRVVPEDAPDEPALRAPSTLYLGSGADELGATIIYRVYVPDVATDLNGGVPLPSPTVTLEPSGDVLQGADACDAATAGVAGTGGQLGQRTLTKEEYLALRDQAGASPTHPAVNPPAWESFFNLNYALGVFAVGTSEEIAAQRAAIPSTQDGGVYSNNDARYIFTHVDRQFGELLVIRGRAPSAPTTRDGDRVMGSGQVRYWSICQNESYYSERVVACAYDEQVPVDGDGYYTVVIGKAPDRPRNARTACGVTWLPWGPFGDGAGRKTAGLVLLRQILADPGYAEAVANVQVPGTEASVMGDYLPTSTYTSHSSFEQRGCPTS